jgi:adenylate cyclase
MVKFLIHRPKWIVAVVGVLIFWLTQTEWLQTVQFWQHAEGKLVNNRYLLRGSRTPDANIRLVGLATSSFKLDTLAPEEISASPTLQLMQQPWPWNRKVYAAILDKLMEAGAKVVVFDFVFASETDGDDDFALALQKYKDHVVIGEMFADEKESDSQTKKMTTPNDRLMLPGTESIPGLVTMWPDEDEVIRRVRYRTSIERETLETPNLDPRIGTLLKRRIAAGKIPDDLKHLTTLAVEKFKGRPIAITDADFHLIDYAGGAGTYRPLPLENMFVPALWEKRPYNNGLVFSNKIVVVGPTAEIFHDIHTTPFGETPGPEVQAQIIGALLHHDTGLVETSATTNIVLALVAMVLALFICLGIPQALLKGLLLTGATVAFFAICQFEFTKNNLVIQMMPPLFCLLATGTFGIIFEYTLEQLDKRRYRNVLDRYVSKNVAKTILDDRRSFIEALKGRKQPVTVLFSDIRGFTTMTESSDADKLVAQLNEYFRDMVGSVLKNEGTLQKFIGDAIMAVWGDTHSKGNAEDARGAVTTALQMRAALAKLNADWKNNADRNKLSIGIGVNHGEVIVGNIGHPQRMEFTVLGDGVNLAARLESATKQFHTDVLIGEGVEKLTRDYFIYRAVDLMTVKGKTKPVEVFGLVSDRTVPPPAWLETYHAAVKMYRRREFREAAERFKFTQEQIPGGDYLCEMYLSRCDAYLISPPPKDWDGSFTLSEK